MEIDVVVALRSMTAGLDPAPDILGIV